MTHPPSDHATARRTEAQKVAARLAQLDGVIAVSLYGSTTHGTADASSDVDLKVYWKKLSRRAVEEIALEDFQPGCSASSDDDENSRKPRYRSYHGSVFDLELWHVEADAFREEVRDVTQRCDTDDRKQIAVSLLLAEEPLMGKEWVAGLKAEAAHYPDCLKEAMVQQYLPLPPLALLPIHARRPLSAVFCAQLMCRTVENLCGVLLGLNRMHGSVLNTKLLNRWLDAMTLKPRDFRPRIEAIFGRPAHEALPEFFGLLTETRTLLIKHGMDENRLGAFNAAIESAKAPPVGTAPPLREIAWQAAKSISGQWDTLAVFLFGSAASGTSDALSNVNLGVVCNGEIVPGQIEPLPGFHSILANPHEVSGARVHLHGRDGVRLEYWCWHHHGLKQILSSAAEDSDAGPEHRLVLADLADAEVLIGDSPLQALREAALRAAANHHDRDLERHLHFYPRGKLRHRILARGHVIYFWQLMLFAAENILGVLLALNRQPGLPADARALPAWATRVAQAPQGWAQRLCGVFALPSSAALEEMEALIADTLQMLHASRPEIGADRVLHSYRES